LSQNPQVIASLVSAGRFSSYQEAAGGDPAKAVDLYQWRASLSAACFEAFHYVEVVVRNALDREMRHYCHEDTRLIPWFLLPFASKSQSVFDAKVDTARTRLRSQSPARETRDQIVAGLEFGFWTDLLHGDQEELWRRALCKSFPNSSGKRKDVLDVLERLRLFRNRLAHHDSLLAQDVPLRLQQMLDVVGWVSADARDWLDRANG
jgi:hypothetical protein